MLRHSAGLGAIMVSPHKVIFIVFLIMPIDVHTKRDNLDFIGKYDEQRTICRKMGFDDKGCKRNGIIAFHARTSSALRNVALYTVVVFGKVTLNTGRGYDTRTGKFTAPESGIYSFTWTIATIAKNHFSTDIVINGRMVGFNHVNGARYSNYETASATAIINMEKNDKVWIRARDSGKTTYAYQDRCSFSGFRL
ncbi:heavy metal-binding protein HIP-like [Ostrea edulis]|uniref:heavy metal-binding protein HIP-like n=1 Tax=Ostrea edulis TaxID=37623 RepID=UPI0020950629|nr:heavy metal-binding protein HIP-like [Ostrea edulis]